MSSAYRAQSRPDVSLLLASAERGGHHACRYDLRHLEPGEVIRGVLLCYPPEGTLAGDRLGQ